MTEEYKGRVDRVIFERDGYCIFSLKVGTRSIKCKGTFIGVEIRRHMDLVVRGDWKHHPRYGDDLEVTSFEEVEPNDVDGITRYLIANCEGVGMIAGRRVAQHFGEDTVKILTADPAQIFNVHNLSQAQKTIIHEALTENIAKRDVGVFLMSFDVTKGMVQRIWEKWGAKAKDVLTENPYKLMEIRGIGFRKADEIATRMGIDPRSPLRVKAVIHYLLDEVVGKDGHLFEYRPRLQKQALEFLDGVDSDIYNGCLEELTTEDKVVIDQDRVYSSRHYYSEVHAAELLADMMSPVNRDFDLDAFVERFNYEQAPDGSFRLSDEQLQAVELALVSKVLVITGLPGTGKTTVVKAIVEMYEQMMGRIALMTPTGISAKRLAQLSARPAATIHRSLGAKGEGVWEHGPGNPHPADAVIVDEASMIDQSLLCKLLEGIRKEATLILVGDAAQLPSVGPGNVLRELIRCGSLPVVRLTQIHRQEEASDIITNAHRIHNGERLVINNKDPRTDFKFVQLMPEEDVLARIRRTAIKLQERDLRVQVLSPRHAGMLGVENLNNCLREDLNPLNGQDEIKFKHKSFRVGDRVMVTKNNYDARVFNGDIGTVTHIDKKNGQIHFLVDGNDDPTIYDFEDAASEIVLAYCVTVHKSQGSEWDVVMLPMVKGFSIQLVRNLFYTAVTRARRKVLVYGHMAAADKAIGNNRVQHRNTIFGERLRNLVDVL